MAVLKIRDANGKFVDIQTIKGERGEKGETGDSYTITEEDYSAIAGIVEGDLDPRFQELENMDSYFMQSVDEAYQLAKGANQCVPFDSYSDMIDMFNELPIAQFNVGQNVMIRTLEVPDLWIYGQTSTHTRYTYTSDEDFVTTAKFIDKLLVMC